MNQTIYIIGTHHGYQNLSNDHSHCDFQKLIKLSVFDNDILIIAEENNLEALEENDVSNSTLQLVAENIGLEHLFTEASLNFRNLNGMEQKNEIRKKGFSRNWTDNEIDEKVQHSFRARERYWLNQILNVNIWPVLFVCGAVHTVQFYNLVVSRGINGAILYEDWSNESD